MHFLGTCGVFILSFPGEAEKILLLMIMFLSWLNISFFLFLFLFLVGFFLILLVFIFRSLFLVPIIKRSERRYISQSDI